MSRVVYGILDIVSNFAVVVFSFSLKLVFVPRFLIRRKKLLVQLLKALSNKKKTARLPDSLGVMFDKTVVAHWWINEEVGVYAYIWMDKLSIMITQDMDTLDKQIFTDPSFRVSLAIDALKGKLKKAVIL